MIKQQAIEVLKLEAKGILDLVEKIDDNFETMVNMICNSTGRLIVAGIGKSGLVGKKIVATLNSTGTRSIFLHPVEAMHGDLGIVSKDDIFLALSNSGETEELNMLVPIIRKEGCFVIAMTGNKASSLAKHSDLVIDVGVEKEACPLGLAPTTSTTALLAMGDALSVVLINKKKFTSVDFQKFHPGGKLGQRLSSKVENIMLKGEAVPMVLDDVSMHEAVKVIDRFKLGAVLVIKKDNILSGIITDGDLRRLIAGKKNMNQLAAKDIMTKNPRTVHFDSLAYDALNIMERYLITVLPVTNSSGKLEGILHLHDILGKGEFKFNGA